MISTFWLIDRTSKIFRIQTVFHKIPPEKVNFLATWVWEYPYFPGPSDFEPNLSTAFVRGFQINSLFGANMDVLWGSFRCGNPSCLVCSWGSLQPTRQAGPSNARGETTRWLQAVHQFLFRCLITPSQRLWLVVFVGAPKWAMNTGKSWFIRNSWNTTLITPDPIRTWW